MRVLLDEQLPRHLAREIAAHDISTVQQRGWGPALRMASFFELPLTRVLKFW
jgi:predicted nuclease of predicted toxin-antitoxin system